MNRDQGSGCEDVSSCLSIIIVTYNTRSVTVACIDSVLKYSRGLDGSLQIVVIDNGSSDGTRDAVLKKNPKIDYIYNTENSGFSKAVNQGINASRGEILAFLNSDTLLQSGIFPDIIRFFRNNPATGIMGGKIVFPDGSIQLSAWKFPNLSRELVQRVFIYRVAYRVQRFRKYKSGFQNPVATDWVTGAFFVCRKKVFDDIGLFDENFFMYYEDTDLCKRAKNKGWEIVFNPNISLVHYDALSRKKEPGRIYLEARKSQIYYYEKHLGAFQANVLKKVVWLFMKINILKCLGLQLFKDEKEMFAGSISTFESVLREVSKKR
ncbi:MAG: glycosyltransferase family 2 protein [Nitrospinota bacterium]